MLSEPEYRITVIKSTSRRKQAMVLDRETQQCQREGAGRNCLQGFMKAIKMAFSDLSRSQTAPQGSQDSQGVRSGELREVSNSETHQEGHLCGKH